MNLSLPRMAATTTTTCNDQVTIPLHYFEKLLGNYRRVSTASVGTSTDDLFGKFIFEIK